MAAAMRGCEYEYVAERERGLRTVRARSSYELVPLPLCVTVMRGVRSIFQPCACPDWTYAQNNRGSYGGDFDPRDRSPSPRQRHRHGRARSFQCVRRVVCPESERSGEQSAFQHIDSDIRLRHRAKNAPRARPDQSEGRKCCVCREFHVRNRNG